MPICHRCRREIEPDSLFCRFCGERAYFFEPSFEQVAEEDYRTFIGKRADYYLEKFRKFRIAGRDRFAVTWNWPAFFLGFIWMLYRKMYLWALVAFLIALTPVAFPLTMIAWGISGNYLYYLLAGKKILEYKSRKTASPTALSLARSGGVNRWVWFLGIFFFFFLLFLMLLGIFFLFYLLQIGYFHPPEIIET
jgi:hypothetical protein